MPRKPSNYPARICANIPRELDQQLRRFAKAAGVSKAAVVRAAFEDGAELLGIPDQIRTAWDEDQRAALPPPPPPSLAPLPPSRAPKRRRQKKTAGAAQVLLLPR
jgi:hypothetical protein